jgi:thiamine-monophosphate kinase
MEILKLSDLGERRILNEIIPLYAQGTGDDCAVIPIERGFLVLTTDPSPRPAAEVIAGDADPYWMGWLLVTINASDIAASGARPGAFLAALDLPRDWPTESLERMLSGIRDSCAANGLKYIGGNIREAPLVSAVGTATGVSSKPPLTRTGVRAGSKLAIVGKSGQFWSDVFDFRQGLSVSKRSSPLFTPISQSNSIFKLHENELISCAMDTSDGLAPTLEELASKNKLGISIDLAKIRLLSKGLTKSERPERLWMGWGDWTVVLGVESKKIDILREFCNNKKIPLAVIGEFSDQYRGVLLKDGEKVIHLDRLESERFSSDSWFHLGVNAYEKMLTEISLP